MWGLLKGIGSFFRRQSGSKTGKFAITMLVTAAASAIGGEKLTPYVPDIIDSAIRFVGDPLNTLYAIGLMFLRDQGLKERG